LQINQASRENSQKQTCDLALASLSLFHQLFNAGDKLGQLSRACNCVRDIGK
jgi:hypothetical protein